MPAIDLLKAKRSMPMSTRSSDGVSWQTRINTLAIFEIEQIGRWGIRRDLTAGLRLGQGSSLRRPSRPALRANHLDVRA